MTLTTIKVTKQTRDLLKAQADAANQTLGEYLAQLARSADRQSRFTALREAIAGSSKAQQDSYAAETAEWEQTELSDQTG
jgi:Ni/Co efflux regulator RcnB